MALLFGDFCKMCIRDRYASYWTQQWLAIKVGWYTLSGGEGEDLAKKRLTSYLQEQYLERVLDPVAEEINPEVVRENVLTLYIRLLGEQLQEIRGGFKSEVQQLSLIHI